MYKIKPHISQGSTILRLSEAPAKSEQIGTGARGMPAGLCKGMRELEGEKEGVFRLKKLLPIAGDVAVNVLDTVNVPCLLGSTRNAAKHESLLAPLLSGKCTTRWLRSKHSVEYSPAILRQGPDKTRKLDQLPHHSGSMICETQSTGPP